MFHDQGCHGSVGLGRLPEVARARLAGLPGEWLEYEPASGALVVRHIQPSTEPCLPTITHELVRMLASVPVELHDAIAGGEFYVHTEDSPHVVRLRVERGGEVRITWAYPHFARAARRPYAGALDLGIDPVFCRLTGTVTLGAANVAATAAEIQQLADTFEGLYPEGHFQAAANAVGGVVRVEMRDANLDIRLLVELLMRLAMPGSASGAIEVSTFDVRYPDDRARVVFEQGEAWLEEPTLFDETPAIG